MARRFKPTHLKVISGSRRIPQHAEPMPTGNLHEPPAWLNESQREGWNYAIEHAPHGLLKHLDCAILTIWVIAEDLHRQASLKVSEVGMLIKTLDSGMPMQSP